VVVLRFTLQRPTDIFSQVLHHGLKACGASVDDAPVAPSTQAGDFPLPSRRPASARRFCPPPREATLFSATLVCRDWAAAAGAVLWRSVPTYAFDLCRVSLPPVEKMYRMGDTDYSATIECSTFSMVILGTVRWLSTAL
jgi:hypothetical protein